MNFNDEFEDISSSSSDDNGFRISKTVEPQKEEPAKPSFPTDLNENFVFEGEQPMPKTGSQKSVSLNKFNNSKAKQKAKTKLIAFNIITSTVLVLSILCTFAMGAYSHAGGGILYKSTFLHGLSRMFPIGSCCVTLACAG